MPFAEIILTVAAPHGRRRRHVCQCIARGSTLVCVLWSCRRCCSLCYKFLRRQSSVSAAAPADSHTWLPGNAPTLERVFRLIACVADLSCERGDVGTRCCGNGCLPRSRRKGPWWLGHGRVGRDPGSTRRSPLGAMGKIESRAKVDVRHVDPGPAGTRVRRCCVSDRFQHTGTWSLPRFLRFGRLPGAGIVRAIRRCCVIVVATSLAPHRSLTLPLPHTILLVIITRVRLGGVDQLERSFV